MRISIVVSLVAGLILAASGPGLATSVTFVGDDQGLIDGTQRMAQAVFTQTDNGMTVTLTNLAPPAVTGGGDILTGVFFNFKDSSPSLTAITALLAPSPLPTHPASSIVNPTHSSEGWDKKTHEPIDTPAAANVRLQVQNGNVTGEWAYSGAVDHEFSQPALNEGPVTVNYGISSSGLGSFGPGNLFTGDVAHPSVSLDNPLCPGGPNYGIAILGADLSNPGQEVGQAPLIEDTVTFTLTGQLDVANIKDVWFQYGTAFSEPDFTVYVGGNPPGIPEPVTMAGVCLGLCGLAGYVRKRR